MFSSLMVVMTHKCTHTSKLIRLQACQTMPQFLPRRMEYTCNSSTWENEAGGLQVTGRPKLYVDVILSQKYIYIYMYKNVHAYIIKPQLRIYVMHT